MMFEHNQKIVFIGDSITDCGRRDSFAPDGLGYVALVKAFLLARYPELHLDIRNRGVGGDTTRNLLARWEEDVVADVPDWLSIKIGINDIWRQFQNRPEDAVRAPEFEENLRRLVQRAVDVGCRLIMIEPYLIEDNQEDPQLVMTREYGEIVRGVAAEYGAIFVPVQDAFDTALQATDSNDWSNDRVHPNLAGHAIIAQRVLRAVGFEFASGGAV